MEHNESIPPQEANPAPQPAAKPPKKKRRWLRRLLWFGVFLLFFPFLLVGLFLLFWQIGPSRTLVRSVGLSVAAGFLDGKLQIDSLGGTLLTGLEVNGLRWYSRDGKLMAGLGKLDVRYDLMHFLKQGELLVEHVILEKPEGYLFVQKDGKINLLAHLKGSDAPTPPPPPPPTTPPAPSTFKLRVPKIIVRDLQFAWGEGEKAIRIHDLNLATDFAMLGPKMLATLRELRLDVKNPDVKVKNISLRFSMEGDALAADDIKIDFGERSALYLDAKIKDLKTLDLDVVFKKLLVAASDVKKIVPPYPIPHDLIADELTAKGTLADLQAAIRLRLGKAKIGLQAKAGILSQSYDVKLALDQINLADLLNQPALQSQIAISLAAKGKGFSDKTQGDVHFQLKPGSFQQYRFQDVTVIAKLDRGNIAVSTLRVLTPYANIPKGEAFVRLSDGYVKADIAGKIPDLSKIGRIVKQNLRGKIDFRVKAVGKNFLPAAELSVSGSGIAHPAARVASLKLDAALISLKPTIQARVKRLSVTDVRAGGQRVRSFDLGLRYKMEKGTDHLVDLDILSFDIGTGVFSLQRQRDQNNRFKPIQLAFRNNDTATVNNLYLLNRRDTVARRMQRRLERLRKDIAQTPAQQVPASLTAQAYRDFLYAQRKIPKLHRYCQRYYTNEFSRIAEEEKAAKRKDEEAEKARALRRQQRQALDNPDADATASKKGAKKKNTKTTRSKRAIASKKPTRSKKKTTKTAKATSPASKQPASKRKPRLTALAALRFTPKSCQTILQDEERFTVDALNACPSDKLPEAIKLPRVRFNIKGRGQSLRFGLENFAVGCLTHNLGIMRQTPPKGFLSVSLDVGGNFRKPILQDLDIQLKEGQFDRFQDLALHVKAHYKSDNLFHLAVDASSAKQQQIYVAGQRTTRKIPKKLLAVRVNLPIRAAIQGMPKQPLLLNQTPQDDLLHLELPKISLDWLARILNQRDPRAGRRDQGKLNLGGEISAAISLKGSLRQPRLNLRFALDNGRFEQLRDLDVKLDMSFRDGEFRIEEKSNRIKIKDKNIVEIGGSFPLHLRINEKRGKLDVGYWLADTPMRFLFKINEQTIDDWRAFVPANLKDKLNGKLDAAISLAGRPSAPHFDFDINLKSGSLCPMESRLVPIPDAERRALLREAKEKAAEERKALQKQGKQPSPKRITLDDIPLTRSVSEFVCERRVATLVKTQQKAPSLRVNKIDFDFGIHYRPRGEGQSLAPQCPQRSGCLMFDTSLRVGRPPIDGKPQNKQDTYFELPKKTNWIGLDIALNPKTLQPTIALHDKLNLDFSVPGLPLRALYRFLRLPVLLQIKETGKLYLSLKLDRAFTKPRLALQLKLKDVGYEMSRDADDKPIYLDGIHSDLQIHYDTDKAKVTADLRVLDQPFLTNTTQYDITAGADIAVINNGLPGAPRQRRRRRDPAVLVKPGRFFSNRLTFHNFKLQNLEKLGGIYNKFEGVLGGTILLEGDPACPEWKESSIELRDVVLGERAAITAQLKAEQQKTLAAYNQASAKWREYQKKLADLAKKINEHKKATPQDSAGRRPLLDEQKSLQREYGRFNVTTYLPLRRKLASFSRKTGPRALRFSHLYIGLSSWMDAAKTKKDGRTRIVLLMKQNGRWTTLNNQRVLSGMDMINGLIEAPIVIALDSIQDKTERMRRCPAWKDGQPSEDLLVKLDGVGSRLKLDFIEAFAPGIEMKGELRLAVNLSGTLKEPQIKSGQVGAILQLLKMEDFGVELGQRSSQAAQGFKRIEASRFLIFLEPKQYRIETRLFGKTGDPFSIDGWIAHKGFVPQNMKIAIRSKEFKPMETLRHRAIIQTKIDITEGIDAPKIHGRITIPEFLFTLPESSRKPQIYNEDEDIYVLGEPSKKRKKRDPFEERPPPTGITQKMNLDLSIVIPRNFFVRNRDLSIEAKTEDFRPLGVRLQTGRLKLTGGLQLMRGEISVYGKKFLVEPNSAVSFTGQSFAMDELGNIDPKLAVTAVYIVKVQGGTSLGKQGFKRVKVLLKVSGSAQDPVLDFEVRDADTEQKLDLDRINVISLILTGTTTEDLSRSQQNNLTNQAVGMVGSMVASELKNALSGVVKMDVLNIETGTQVSDLKVEAGWYLTPDIYLEVAVKPAPLEEESYLDMRVDYAINRNWSLELRSGLVKRNDALWFRGSGYFFFKRKF